MRKTLLSLILAVTGIVMIAFGATYFSPLAHSASPVPAWVTTPCTFEDSIDCYWDAGGVGNDGGHSFLAHYVPSSHLTCVFYVQRGYAKKHDTCFDDGLHHDWDLDRDGHGAERG